MHNLGGSLELSPKLAFTPHRNLSLAEMLYPPLQDTIGKLGDNFRFYFTPLKLSLAKILIPPGGLVRAIP